MISTDQIQTLLGSGGTVVGDDGSRIGKLGQVYLDDETGNPEWLTVKTGMFAGSESFIPLAESSVSGDQIRVPYGKDTVKDAPRMEDSEASLSQDQEAELYRYYGLRHSDTGSDSGLRMGGPGLRGDRNDRADEPSTVGRDASGATTDDAMTRSEERLHVSSEKVQSGKARLRKFVVTQNVTQTVPVSHDEVRLEREPITDANRDAAMAGEDLSSEEHEVVLTEERVVVDKETVAVERVRMDTETVTENQQVTEEVRKEQVEADTSDAPQRGKKR